MSEAVQAVISTGISATRAPRHWFRAFFISMRASLAIQNKFGFVRNRHSASASALRRGAEIDHIDTELTRDAFYKALETQ